MKYIIPILAICLSMNLMAQDKKKKFKPTKDMQSIQVLSGKMEIKAGTTIYYTGNVHGSVGETFSISADSGLKFVEEYFEYNDPKKAEMPGGDAATNTFVYKAEKPGTYEVRITDKFRGEVQNKYVVTITVTE